jgi:U32 family peptidase
VSPRPPKPEVLAPAGSPQALRAALQSGADAVYFGLQDGFNARARAANFSLADLPATVAQIHRAGARAYVTLNTLLFEPELAAIEGVLRAVVVAGVDAVIVQDPAVCLLAQALCPQLELHGSTQMTISSARGATFARALGITRVVVPRELSVREIADFAAGTPLELEVFVHGALCVSWSGQCLTSEAWGGRSANRGQCAQSCRMPYELVVDGVHRELGDVRYLLSPKDLAGARAVPELLQIGVHGLKIEGRQKGPLYVATATAGYRRWVDALCQGADSKQATRQLAQDLLAMELAYSRGTSTGFLAGSDHQTLVEGRFPKHRGVAVGRVVRVSGNRVLVRRDGQERPWTGGIAAAAAAPPPQSEVQAPLAADVAPAELHVTAGMGCVFDQGRPETEEPGGPIFGVETIGDGLHLLFGNPGPDLTRVRPGDRVFVTGDPLAASTVERQQHAPEPSGRHALTLKVHGAAGDLLTVHARCGAHAATAASVVPLQAARGRGLDAALLRSKLGAFGGTPFHLEHLDASGLADGLHLPPGELKDLRRRLVEALLPAIERGAGRALAAEEVLPRVRARLAAAVGGREHAGVAQSAHIVPLVRSDAQLAAVVAHGCREVVLDWMEFQGLGRALATARAAGLAVTVATPRIGKPMEAALDEHLWRLQPDAILVRHWGAMMGFLAARGAAMHPRLYGDFSLNVTNSLTADFLLGMGLDAVTAAYDLDETQLFALLAEVPAGRVGVTAHQRMPTFHTEHCVYSHLLSNGRDFRSCGRPCERHQVALRDHVGREHPVIVDVGCRNTVFHHAPQTSAKWVQGLRAAGVRTFRVEFVCEDASTVGTVLQAWDELLRGTIDATALAGRTGAESRFGVVVGGMQLLVE